MSRWKIKTRRGKLDFDSTRSILRRFREYIRPHRAWILVAFAAAMGSIGMRVLTPWPIKIIFDYILTHKMGKSWLANVLDQLTSGPMSALAWVCGGVLFIAAFDSLCTYVRDVVLAQTGQRVVGQLRQDLFAHLQTLPPADTTRHHTGGLLVRLTSDIQMLRQMLVNAIVTGGENGLLIVAMVSVMFWLNPLLALVGLFTIPITIGASWRISRQIRKATDQQREQESRIASVAHDVLGAMSITQAYNREEIEEKRFARQNRRSIRAGVKATKLASKLDRIVSLASAVTVCVILYLGVRSVLLGVMTAGDLLVFVSYLRSVNKPLRKISKLAGQVAKATSCGRRVAEIFAIQPSVCDRTGAVALSDPEGRVALEGVTFCYDPDRPALSNITMDIAPGERVAFVGHTGAGKSTLIKLLLRFHDPQEGVLRIDGTDLRDIRLRSLRRHIGWVHQDTVLFGMSVAENIALGKPHAEPEEIAAAAQRVMADEFIENLPDGYETVLGQGGHTLSGGQRQRIALSRALLREPPILLLDEPVTGLDPMTMQVVEQAWLSPRNKATTLVVCHRLREMGRFDRIFVLSHGQICESGTHDDLLAKDGEYAAMLRASGDDRARAATSQETAP